MPHLIVTDENGKKLTLVKPAKAREMLNVSKQRISYMIKNETIPVYYVLGAPFFKYEDLKEYKEQRKVGRPAKLC